MSIKQAKIDYIVSIASELFLSKGIESVTIKDITQKVGVGEATIYRYFTTKQNLVIQAARTMADQIHTKYFDLSKATTGIGKMEAFYSNFLKIYEEHPEYFRFISEFDSIIKADVNLDQYEATLLPYVEDYLDAYNLGLKDGTINKIDKIKLFYLTSTHALMGICKKLTMDSIVLKQDTYGKQEVETLIDIIIYKLNKTN